jgi:hypothetical protein
MARTAMLVIATFAVMSVAINAQTTIETPAGSFTTQASVSDQLQVSAKVATIMQQLTDSDFAAAKQTYENSDLLKVLLTNSRNLGCEAVRPTSTVGDPATVSVALIKDDCICFVVRLHFAPLRLLSEHF